MASSFVSPILPRVCSTSEFFSNSTGCHIPPIPDPELIAIIKTYNEARKHNPNASLNWKCGSCLKPKSKTIDSSDKPRQTHNTKDNPIVIDSDSDDKVTVVEKSGSSKQLKRTATRTISPSDEVTRQITRKSADRAVRIIDDPVDFPVRPSQERSSSSRSSSNVLTSSIGHLSVSDDQLRDNDGDSDGLEHATPKPSSPRTKKDVRGWSTNPQTPNFAPPVAETGLERASVHKSAKRRSTSNSMPSRPPHTSSLIESPGSNTGPGLHLRLPESRSTLSPDLLRQFQEKTITFTVSKANTPGTNDQTTPEPRFHPALLPHYINSRYHESTNKGDIWHSVALRNSKAKRSMAATDPDRETSTSPSSASRSFSDRKRKAPSRGPNTSVSTSMGSKDPFFFSVDVWMKEKEAALALFEFE